MLYSVRTGSIKVYVQRILFCYKKRLCKIISYVNHTCSRLVYLSHIDNDQMCKGQSQNIVLQLNTEWNFEQKEAWLLSGAVNTVKTRMSIMNGARR